MDACPFKTDCLRLALEAEEGLVIQEEVVDRAYHAGLLTFMQRWSRKKRLRTKATARND